MTVVNSKHILKDDFRDILERRFDEIYLDRNSRGQFSR